MTDLAIGGKAMPIGLSFQRYYDSGTQFTNGAMGLGWTHNFAITALADSDPYEGLAVNSPINGAAAIAALFVLIDIGNTGVVVGRPIDRFVIGSVACRWLTDNLTGNIVAIKQPGTIEHFVKLPDGSYNPPFGSGATLAFNGTNYTYVAKDQTTLVFNASGNLASWTSPAGPALTLTYTGSSPEVLSSVTNSFGRSLTFAYTSGLLTQVTDDGGRSVSYGYDTNSNLTSFVDPLGQTTSYAYDNPGRMTQIVYPWAPSVPYVTNTYDSLSRVKTQANVFGQTWSYFLAGARSEEVDPLGMRHALYNTPRGKTTTEILDLGGANQTTTTSTWDALDRLTLATAPEGNTVGYTYDLKSNLLTVTRTPKPGSPLSPLVTTTTYDATYNKPLTVTDPRGLVTAMGYDPATGNLISIVADSANLKATTQYTYAALGQLQATIDPVGTVTQNTYDSSGSVISTVRDAGTGRLNQTTSLTYNARGDPLTVTDPRGNVATSTYDAARRVLTTTTPPTAAALAGVVTAYAYDPAGRVTQTQQSSFGTVLRTTSSTYTLSGKTATATDARGNTTTFAYDLLDRLTTATDPMSRVTQYGYDRLSRPVSASNPAISATALVQQSFTANGLRASLTDANGNVSSFAYDGLDRLASTTYPDASAEALSYDADSNVTLRCTRAGQPIGYGYDTLNRRTAKIPPGSASGCSATPSGVVVTYSYDLAGRRTGVSDTSASIVAAVPPGGAASVSYTTSYSYDAMNRPIGVGFSPVPAATPPSSASSVLFGHSYNAANQRIGQTVSDNSWIAYPTATGVTGYTANNLNQYTAVGGITPTYDANGNLTGDGTNSYTHDAENRLVAMSGGGNTASYVFDGRGRRKTRTVNGTTVVSVTDAGNREVLEYDGRTGVLLRWYAYGLGPNEVLGQTNVAAATRFAFVSDNLGSIIGQQDASTGALSSFGYHPYGASPSAPAQFGYTGQRVDAESGLYYYRARHYHPGWGRFLQTDPIGHAGGLLLYAYMLNDPANGIDPFGTAQCDPSPYCGSLDAALNLVAQARTSPRITSQQQQLLSDAYTLLSGDRIKVVFGPTLPNYAGMARLNTSTGIVTVTLNPGTLGIMDDNSLNSTLLASALLHEGGAHGRDLIKLNIEVPGTVSQERRMEQDAYGLEQTFLQAVGANTNLWNSNWTLPETDARRNSAAEESVAAWSEIYRQRNGVAPPPMVAPSASGSGK